MIDRPATEVRPSRPSATPARRVLGRGRSGLVYSETLPGETPAAVKVFLGDPAGDLVTTLLTGAPAAYGWCEAAVRCAMHRRNVLAGLVDYWFGDRLRVASARGVRWSDADGAWELRCDQIDGRPAALHHPFSGPTDREQGELRDQVMRPLQARLREAGFVGMLWQAGLGNPVAADNFLRDRTERSRWVWIDLESGVPALFPLDPRPLFGTYLPWTLRLRRPLFDDTEVGSLCAYLDRERSGLRRHLGAPGLAALEREVESLARSQGEWKGLGRTSSGLLAALVKGRIDERAAERYLEHPLLWTLHEARTVAIRAVRAGLRRLRAAWSRLRTYRPAAALRATGRFVVSQTFRDRVARRLVLLRIRAWRRRGQLGAREAGYLRRQARFREQAAYLTDFVVHLAMKPLYKTVVWLLLPAAVQLGWLPLWVVPVGLVAGGSICRSLYTVGRGLQGAMRREPFPWIALLVGLLPIVGSAAYPVQLVASSRRTDGKLAALMLYDTTTETGRRIPIWGGADSRTEHLLNRLPDLIVHGRDPLLVPASEDRIPG